MREDPSYWSQSQLLSSHTFNVQGDRGPEGPRGRDGVEGPQVSCFPHFKNNLRVPSKERCSKA